MSKEEWTNFMKFSLEKEIEKYFFKQSQNGGVLARRGLYKIYCDEREFDKWIIENFNERCDIDI